jgi:uncharacterized protein DUF4157
VRSHLARSGLPAQREAADERGRSATRHQAPQRPSAAQLPAWSMVGNLQAQLTVGAVDDPLEREADQVAEAETGVPAPPPAGAPSLPADGSDDDSAGGVVQRSADGAGADTPPTPGWQDLVRSATRAGTGGGGRPVPADVREPLEARLRVDLETVRVHDDGPADTAARAVGARAFTVGDDVVFRSGEYQTGTAAGRRLLAHELTHVAQQRGGAAPGPAATRATATAVPARVQRAPDPPGGQVGAPAGGQAAPKEQSMTFTITPDKVMTAQEFRVWVMMKLLGVDVPTAERMARENDWWGTLSANGVKQKDVGKPSEFYVGMSLYWEHRGGYVRSLPAEARRVLGADKVRPEDYAQLVRIASKLTPAQWADYAARVTGRTTDLDELERSVEAYLRLAQQRAEEAGRYRDVHTKLIGTESLLKQYRAYQKLQKVATEGRTITIVGAAGGGSFHVDPTAAEIAEADAARKTLTDGLVAAGFKGGIPEFELALREFVTGFESQALSLGLTALDHYESFLYKQAEYYQRDDVVQGLYDSLAPYRTAFAEFDVQKKKMETSWARYERESAQSRQPGSSHIRPREADKAAAFAARDAAQAEKDKAIKVVGGLVETHPIFSEKHLPLTRRIDKEALAKADKAGIKRILADHIAARTTDVLNTRDNLRKDPELIYKMDQLMAEAMTKLEVTPGSIFSELVQERVDAIKREEGLIAALKAVLAIAFTILTFGAGAIAVVGAVGLLTLGGVGVYEEYEKFRISSEAAGSGLSSKEPSPMWLVLSVAGVVFDALAVTAAVKALRPAAMALEAGGKVDDFRKAVQLLEQQGQIESKVARSVEAAADARQAYGAARGELRTALLGKAYSFPGPLADPDVYKAVVKMAAAKIRQGIESVNQFILELNAVRVEAKLGELSGEELALAKKAFADAEVEVAKSAVKPTGATGASGATPATGGAPAVTPTTPAVTPTTPAVKPTTPAVTPTTPAAGAAPAVGTAPAAGGPSAAFAQAVAQREAAVAAAEAKIADLTTQRTAAVAKQAADKPGLTKEALAQHAEMTALERRAFATKDPVQKAELEAQAKAARERWEDAKDAQLANQDEIDALNTGLRDARAELATAKTNLQLAEAGFRLQDVPTITARLRTHVDDAAKKVDKAIADFEATGTVDPAVLNPGDMGKVTSAATAGEKTTALAQARGNAIDKLAKGEMAGDKDLAGLVLTPRGKAGPDIVLDISQPGQPPLKRWWDMTTPEQWKAHGKYVDDFGEGIPLFTRPPKPKATP